MLCEMCRTQGPVFLISFYVASLMLVAQTSRNITAFPCKSSLLTCLQRFQTALLAVLNHAAPQNATLQVLGLFIVQTTAAGCLYFLDPTNIANSTGLEAVGIILLVLNVAYVVVMLIMIAVFGADSTKHFTRAAFAVLRTSSTKFKHSVSGLSNSGAVLSASRNLVTIGSMQSQKTFHVSDIAQP